jgi:hypothetical protein
MFRFQLTRIFLTLALGVLVSGGSNLVLAQKTEKRSILAQDNLVAWCIVPFDSKHRTPEERITMLKRLGFSQYAYDWRHEHLASFPAEIKAAREKEIFIAAVWMWLDRDADRPGKLSQDNEQLIAMLEESGLATQLWVGFNHNFYADASDADKVRKGAEMLSYLKTRTQSLVTGIGLYNHGDWFGEPANQIKILKQLNDPAFGLIYNFHHGHGQIESFPKLLKEMQPYLWAVNLNGMKKMGPQILPIGSGDQELEMIRVLIKSGFSRSIGILGHIETEDVELVLQRNLAGLRKLEQDL